MDDRPQKQNGAIQMDFPGKINNTARWKIVFRLAYRGTCHFLRISLYKQQQETDSLLNNKEQILT